MQRLILIIFGILLLAHPVAALERPLMILEPIDEPLEIPVEPFDQPVIKPLDPVIAPGPASPAVDDEVPDEPPAAPQSAAEPASVPVVAALKASGIVPALQFLRDQATTAGEWGALAMIAAGESASGFLVSSSPDGPAIDLTRRILGLVAVGRDASELVEKLESLVINGHLGTNTLINDDIFGVLALCAAGRTFHGQPLSSLTRYVVANQRADGGWGVTTTSGSDVDDTAAAIQSLDCVGEQPNSVSRGISYLRSQQQSDGGFPFRKPAASNSASTSWGLHALDAVGASLNDWKVNGLSPRDALLTFQNSDGGFRWQTTDSQSTVLLTSYAVIALAGRHLPVIQITIEPPPPPAPVPTPDLVPVPHPPPVPETPVVPESIFNPEPPHIEEPEFTSGSEVAVGQSPTPTVKGAETILPVAGIGLAEMTLFSLGFILTVLGAVGLRNTQKKTIIC